MLFEQGLSMHALNNRLGQNIQIKEILNVTATYKEIEETLNLHKQTDKEIPFCLRKQGGETTILLNGENRGRYFTQTDRQIKKCVLYKHNNKNNLLLNKQTNDQSPP